MELLLNMLKRWQNELPLELLYKFSRIHASFALSNTNLTPFVAREFNKSK